MKRDPQVLFILLFVLLTRLTYAQKEETKRFNVHLDSSSSKVTYKSDAVFCETTFDSKKIIQVYFKIKNEAIQEFGVTDSCGNGENAFYNYELNRNKEYEGGIGHSIVPCIAFSLEDMSEMMSEKYHYRQEDVKSFCLELYDRIKIVKKTIYLD